MSYKVKIENFEGPFDLLLYLVSQQKLDVTTISITEIIDQYLDEVAHMTNLDLDIMSDFLLVAATLLEIKARTLTKSAAPEDEEFEDIAELSPNEARSILIEKLLTYKQYKNASVALLDRYAETQKMRTRPFGPDMSLLHIVPDYTRGIKTENLAYIAAMAFARRDIFLLESSHIASAPISLEKHVRGIHGRIVREKHLMFSDVLKEGKTPEYIVVNFLAILELYKRGMVHLQQKQNFDDIEIDYIEGSGDLVLTGDDNALTSEEFEA